MPIIFQNADVKFSVKQKIKLRDFIGARIIEAGWSKFEVDYIFCSDEYLLEINRNFLGHVYYTDIITFPLSENDTEMKAEIYISVDRVRENAQKFGKKEKSTAPNQIQLFDNELNRVIFHGILHLLGYKDKTKAQKAKMRNAEAKWLKQYLALSNVPRGTR
jgi:probable rRNA maturation factor